MNKRLFGKNGQLVSEIGIGGMSFTDFYGKTNKKNSFDILNKAIDFGIDHIDTSNFYGQGHSEKIIGAFLKHQGKQKNNYFKIATKAGITFNEETGKRIYNNERFFLEQEIDESLKRLGVDAIDLFYIHRRDTSIPIQEVTQYLVEIKKKGKIKSFGYSEIAPSSLKLAEAVHEIAAVQSEYSLSVRSPELGLVQHTCSKKIALVAFSPLGRSMLTDRPFTNKDEGRLSFMKENPRFIEPNLTYNLDITNKFRELAASFGISSAGLAIAWLLQSSPNVIPIPGTRSIQHLNEIIEGTNFVLDKEKKGMVNKVLPVGWAHGDRYSNLQWNGPERYC